MARIVSNLSAKVQLDNRGWVRASRQVQTSNRATRTSLRNLRTGMTQTTAVSNALSSAFTRLGAIATGFISVQAVRSVIDFGGEISETSRRVGIAVEQFQRLRFAAELTGVATGQVERLFTTFGTRLARLQLETSSFRTELESIDESLLEVFDNATSVSGAFDVYVRALREADGELQRLALSQAALGQGLGATGVQLLTGEGVQAQARADQLSLVLDENELAVLEGIGDTLTEVSRKLTVEVARGIIGISDTIRLYFEPVRQLVYAIGQTAPFRAYEGFADFYEEQFGRRPNPVEVASFAYGGYGLARLGLGVGSQALGVGASVASQSYTRNQLRRLNTDEFFGNVSQAGAAGIRQAANLRQHRINQAVDYLSGNVRANLRQGAFGTAGGFSDPIANAGAGFLLGGVPRPGAVRQFDPPLQSIYDEAERYNRILEQLGDAIDSSTAFNPPSMAGVDEIVIDDSSREALVRALADQELRLIQAIEREASKRDRSILGGIGDFSSAAFQAQGEAATEVSRAVRELTDIPTTYIRGQYFPSDPSAYGNRNLLDLTRAVDELRVAFVSSDRNQPGIQSGIPSDYAPLVSPIGRRPISVARQNEAAEGLLRISRELQESFQSVEDTIGRGITDALLGARSAAEAFGDVMRSILDEIISRLISQPIANFLVSGITSLIGGSFGSFAVGGGPGIQSGIPSNYAPRAMGGAVAGGQTYLVGERGPEYFTPGTSGYVGAGGSAPTININVNGVQDPTIVRNEIRRTLPEISKVVGASVISQQRTPGQSRKQFG